MMDASDMVKRLVGYYKGAYGEERLSQLNRFCGQIVESARETVFDRIIETRDGNTPIGVVDIKDACNAAGVAFTVSHFVETEDWTCDACGHRFKYSMIADDDIKIDKNIYDVCPMCGFQPGWTVCKNYYLEIGQAEPDWYRRLMKECNEKHGPPDKNYPNREGIFWSRSEAEKERKDKRKKLNDAKLEAMRNRISELSDSKIYSRNN